jgi:hypothetical protein
VKGHEQLKLYIKNYYTDLFGALEEGDFNVVLSSWKMPRGGLSQVVRPHGLRQTTEAGMSTSDTTTYLGSGPSYGGNTPTHA